MDATKFLGMCGLLKASEEEQIKVLDVMDDFYLRYTREQALQLLKMYYDNADDIWNSRTDSKKVRLTERD